MTTKIVKDSITREELKTLAQELYGDIIKAVVDVEQKIMGVGGEFHSEIEALLIEQENSKRDNTWGINLVLDETWDNFIEFDSMINLKPVLGNKTRSIENSETKEKIREIVKTLIHE